MIIMHKEGNNKLTENLRHNELKCHCVSSRCNYTLIHPKVLNDFEELRKEFGKPIKVNSAFRCQRHNAEVGGVPASFHTIGLAIDLAPAEKMVLKEFKYQLNRLKILADSIFDVVIDYDTFIHCHNKEITE